MSTLTELVRPRGTWRRSGTTIILEGPFADESARQAPTLLSPGGYDGMLEFERSLVVGAGRAEGWRPISRRRIDPKTTATMDPIKEKRADFVMRIENALKRPDGPRERFREIFFERIGLINLDAAIVAAHRLLVPGGRLFILQQTFSDLGSPESTLEHIKKLMPGNLFRITRAKIARFRGTPHVVLLATQI